MEITVEKFDGYPEDYSHDDYTIYVGDHRILTVNTMYYATATKWLKDVHKINHNNKHGSLLVGVCVDRQSNNLKDSPYELIQICVGSHCLIYRLPNPNDFQSTKSLQAFFADPNVMVVGMNMVSVAKKLESDHGIKFSNPVDLNSMAEKGMNRNDLDLGRYNLDRLAKTVLGKHWDVVRPERPAKWCDPNGWFWYQRKLLNEKVKYSTVDAYLCFLIGFELLDIMNGSYPSSSSKKSKKKKKTKF